MTARLISLIGFFTCFAKLNNGRSRLSTLTYSSLTHSSAAESLYFTTTWKNPLTENIKKKSVAKPPSHLCILLFLSILRLPRTVKRLTNPVRESRNAPKLIKLTTVIRKTLSRAPKKLQVWNHWNSFEPTLRKESSYVASFPFLRSTTACNPSSRSNSTL